MNDNIWWIDVFGLSPDWGYMTRVRRCQRCADREWDHSWKLVAFESGEIVSDRLLRICVLVVIRDRDSKELIVADVLIDEEFKPTSMTGKVNITSLNLQFWFWDHSTRSILAALEMH